jgi:hypothetical protein
VGANGSVVASDTNMVGGGYGIPLEWQQRQGCPAS